MRTETEVIEKLIELLTKLRDRLSSGETSIKGWDYAQIRILEWVLDIDLQVPNSTPDAR